MPSNPASPLSRNRSRWKAWAASALIHAGILLVLALVTFVVSRQEWTPTRDTVLPPIYEQPLPVDIEADLEILPAGDAPDAGGRQDGPGAGVNPSDAISESAVLDVDRGVTMHAANSARVLLASHRRLDGLSLGDRIPGGQGTGTGSGIGPGSGPGFFGWNPGVRQVVFVVDNSRSMNHPHDSPLKTRFRRLKFELLKSIAEMTPEQSYFVVFFSNETTPMPANGLQPAVNGLRERHMAWIGQLLAGGAPTDPTGALLLALNLQPDAICFLTDGEFPAGINRKLLQLRQSRSRIHTFAFGDTIGEEVLKTVAANNGGEYRFVP